MLLKSPKGGSFRRQRKLMRKLMMRLRRRRELRTPSTMRPRTLRRRKPRPKKLSTQSKVGTLRKLRTKEQREKVRASVLAPIAS